uniref:Plastid lipid-associated protein/fibrillin conserved domain-containing protein n=1 Tax=Compsopogon caeruleus TaxID=31354 RepID=A0A7S1TG77_9RHOD|mmetsp:Transcript_4453/g.8837  ORF Transcript_4453/g.8837 Transcript_4453/m.8837 type:complete len:309 (+) Transcript_4453:128-1054(+)
MAFVSGGIRWIGLKGGSDVGLCGRVGRKNEVRRGGSGEIVRRGVGVGVSTDAMAKVDRLLNLIEDTDSGAVVSKEERSMIDGIIFQLEDERAGEDLLSDPLLFGNFKVAYVSARQNYAPAGGRFRSRFGKLVFRTKGLFQHVLSPDRAVNMVRFALFGLIGGCVVLTGRLKKLPPIQGLPNPVRVEFDRPRISLAGAVFEFGPTSEVVLGITYLDDRIRLARGARGSLFVFHRGGDALLPVADSWKPIADTRPLPNLPALVFLGGLVASAFFLPPAITAAYAGLLALMTWVFLRQNPPPEIYPPSNNA